MEKCFFLICTMIASVIISSGKYKHCWWTPQAKQHTSQEGSIPYHEYESRSFLYVCIHVQKVQWKRKSFSQYFAKLIGRKKSIGRINSNLPYSTLGHYLSKTFQHQFSKHAMFITFFLFCSYIKIFNLDKIRSAENFNMLQIIYLWIEFNRWKNRFD